MRDDETDQSADAQMRETLDLLSEVVANVSARVDDQTQALEGLRKTSVETRQAAVAARSQTDPKRYGDIVGEPFEGKIGQTLDRLDGHSDLLTKQLRILADISTANITVEREIRDDLARREAKVARAWMYLPYIGIAFLVFLAVLPSFIGRFEAGCALYSGSWNEFGNFCALDADEPPWFLPGSGG